VYPNRYFGTRLKHHAKTSAPERILRSKVEPSRVPNWRWWRWSASRLGSLERGVRPQCATTRDRSRSLLLWARVHWHVIPWSTGNANSLPVLSIDVIRPSNARNCAWKTSKKTTPKANAKCGHPKAAIISGTALSLDG